MTGPRSRGCLKPQTVPRSRPAADRRSPGRNGTRPSSGRTAVPVPARPRVPRPPACHGQPLGQRLLEQARLADPGLTLDQHDRLTAASHPVQSLRRTPVSVSRPRSRGARAGMPTTVMLSSWEAPLRACARCSWPPAWTGVRRPGRPIQRSQQPEPASNPDLLRLRPGPRSALAAIDSRPAGGSTCPSVSGSPPPIVWALGTANIGQ